MSPMSKLSAEEANAFLAGAFNTKGPRSLVTHMSSGRAIIRLETDATHLRPGDYVSGPTQMSLVDTAAYMVVMSEIGLEPMAVTSQLNMSFLRPCIGAVILADGRMMKRGQSLAVIEVDVRIEGAAKAASHAIVTYALPKSRTAR
jgi:uncharacterized protein (TIGR00369 family)